MRCHQGGPGGRRLIAPQVHRHLAALSLESAIGDGLSGEQRHGNGQRPIRRTPSHHTGLHAPGDAEIEGAVHSFFGDYGDQPGDGTPTIDREGAQDQIVAATLALLERAGAPAG